MPAELARAAAETEAEFEATGGEPVMGQGLALRVGRNFVYRLGSQVVSSIINVVAMVVLGRALAVDGYGRYAFYYALISMIAPLGDAGVGLIIARELARRPWEARRLFGDGVLIKVTLSALILGLACVAAPLLLDPAHAALVLLVTAIGMLDISQDPAIWILRGQERQDLEGMLLLVSQVVWALGLGLMVALHGSLFALLATAGVAFVVRAAVAIVLVVRRWGRPEIRPDLSRLKHLVIEGLPFGVAMCLVTFYARIGLLALRGLSSAADVSAFQVAYLLSQPLGFVAAALSIAVFPAVSRAILEGGDSLRERLGQVVRCQFLLALPMAVLLYVLSPWIIAQSFKGHGFGSAVSTLQILACGLPVIFLNQASRYLLTALDRQADYLWAVGLGCIVNVGLCVLLIPRQGPIGACLAFLAAEVAIGAWCQHALTRRVGSVAVVREAAKPIAATALAGLPLFALHSASPLSLAAIASVLYVLLVWRLGAISGSEMKVVRAIARSFLASGHGTRTRRAGGRAR